MYLKRDYKDFATSLNIHPISVISSKNQTDVSKRRSLPRQNSPITVADIERHLAGETVEAKEAANPTYATRCYSKPSKHLWCAAASARTP